MAAYMFHRLLMGKVEIGNFFQSQWGYLDFFYRNVSLIVLCFVLLLSKLLNLIGCQGNKKGKFSKNVKKTSQKP